MTRTQQLLMAQRYRAKYGSYANVGRKTVVNENVINKLCDAFAMGCTIKEACLYAGISHQTYYDFIAKKPEYTDRFKALKRRPFLLARGNVVVALEYGDVDTAKWYLERKLRKEFAMRQEHSGPGGGPITHALSPDQAKLLKFAIANDQAELNKARRKYNRQPKR